jgi:mannosyltransferase
MDPSSLFTSPLLCNDPFDVMYTHQRLYGYLSTKSDLREYTAGLWPFVRNFSRTHSAVDRQLRANNWEWEDELPGGEGETVGFRGYDTNFEIVKLDAFRRPDVKEWLEAISEYPEGIFKLGWGKSLSRLLNFTSSGLNFFIHFAYYFWFH